jgi:hypothetical protein
MIYCRAEVHGESINLYEGSDLAWANTMTVGRHNDDQVASISNFAMQ